MTTGEMEELCDKPNPKPPVEKEDSAWGYIFSPVAPLTRDDLAEAVQEMRSRPWPPRT